MLIPCSLLPPRAIESLFPLPFPQAKCDLSDREDKNELGVLPLLKGPIPQAPCQLPLPQKGGLDGDGPLCQCLAKYIQFRVEWLGGASGWDLNLFLQTSFPVMMLILISSWLTPAFWLVTLSWTWTCSSLLTEEKKSFFQGVILPFCSLLWFV